MTQQIRRIGVWSSCAGNTEAHRSINAETNRDFPKWCLEVMAKAAKSVRASAALLWCLGGRADPGVDLDFDQMTSSREEGALTASPHSLARGMETIRQSLSGQDGVEIWYYLGIVEKSTRPHASKPFHSGRQWTRMPAVTLETLVMKELAHYPAPALRGRTGFVIDAGAQAGRQSASHKVANTISAMGFAVGGEPLASPTSWMHDYPSTSFVIAAGLAQVEDHSFNPSFSSLPPSATGNIHTAVLFPDRLEWTRLRDRVRRWWDAGCSIYVPPDVAIESGEEVRALLADAPINAGRVKSPAPKAVA